MKEFQRYFIKEETDESKEDYKIVFYNSWGARVYKCGYDLNNNYPLYNLEVLNGGVRDFDNELSNLNLNNINKRQVIDFLYQIKKFND